MERDVLEAAVAAARPVQLIVTDCWFACCGGRALHREGYEQTYRGLIVAQEPYFVLHALALGQINYAVAFTPAGVLDMTFVEPPEPA